MPSFREQKISSFRVFKSVYTSFIGCKNVQILRVETWIIRREFVNREMYNLTSYWENITMVDTYKEDLIKDQRAYHNLL